MTVVADINGLPVMVDEERELMFYDVGKVSCQSKHISLREISPSLLNKSLMYPEFVYQTHCRFTLIDDVSAWPKEINYDVIFIPAGLLGIEYNKTHIFYAQGDSCKAACLVEVLSGVLTVVLQRNKVCDDPYVRELEVEEMQLIEVNAGQKAIIPAGSFYTFVNAGEQPLIIAVAALGQHIASYEELVGLNGMAYFLIAKNARPEVVANPRYRNSTEVKRVSVDELNANSDFKPKAADALYSLVKNLDSGLLGMLV